MVFMTEGKIANQNERVIVNRSFSILIPQGYTYSMDANEINDNRTLVFIKTERNEYFNKQTGDFDYFDLSFPFGAPQCCTITPLSNLDSKLDLSNDSIRQAMRNMFQLVVAMFGGDCSVIKESDDILVYYSKFSGKEKNTDFMFVTPESIYNGQIWLNDISTQKEREKIAKEWLGSIENYILTDADKIHRKPFVVPTYNEQKREQIGTLTVAVPDQMKTLESELEKGTKDITAINDLKKEFAFLAINKDFDASFSLYSDAEFKIKSHNSGIQAFDGLVDFWGTEKKAERKKTFVNLIKNAIPESPYKIHFKDLAEELAVVYTQVKESSDNIEQWASFFVAFFHSDTLINVNIHIDAVLDIPAMEKAIAEWATSARPIAQEKIAEFNKQATIAALGSYAGENGKIDAIKATQFFVNDIFFFVKGQIQANGNHHTLNGLQINADTIDKYPQVKDNLAVFRSALTELLNYVEEEELLVVNEDCVHFKFDELNKIDPPIVNGAKADVKGAKIGKGLSGIRVFLLMAWHLIRIAEIESDKYIVALDGNVYAAIPNAEAYIAQLIKRLRSFNGITRDFEVVYASVLNLDDEAEDFIEIPYVIESRNPLACSRNELLNAITIKENGAPYQIVQKQIEKAREQGVWKTWKRGKVEFEDSALVDKILKTTFVENDECKTSSKSNKTAKKTKVSLNKKASPAVRDVIKQIGVVDTAFGIKGKKFVLSEVKEPVTLAECIVENGGEVTKNVVMTTDYIIIGDKSRSETNKIKQVLEFNETKGMNIRAMCESDFWTLASNPETSEGRKIKNEVAVFQLTQKNEKAIQKLIEQARHAYSYANSKYSDAEKQLEKLGDTSINIYGNIYYEVSRRVEIAADASKNLYETCQNWVKQLDKECTPLITEGVSPKLVQEIADLIEHLNYDSYIELNFSASFEDVSFGRFANVNFSPSYEARDIEKKWLKKAKEFKKAADAAAYAKKKAADAAAYVKKHNIDAKDLKKHKNYESAKALLSKAKTAKNYRDIAEKLSKQKTYLDSKTIYEYCLQKAEALEEYEKAQKACTKRKKDISDLKYDHNVLEEKISKTEDNIKFVSSTLEIKRRTYESSKNETETQFNSLISEAEAKIEQNLDLKDKLEKSKVKLNAELDSAFFLSFGKKNKLKEQIQSAESQISAAKKAISQARMDKSVYEQQKENQLTALDATIANLEEDLKKNEAILPEYQKKLESISNRLVNHEQKLQEEEQLCKELKAKANSINNF